MSMIRGNLYNRGNPRPLPLDDLHLWWERFLSLVPMQDPARCWVWQGPVVLPRAWPGPSAGRGGGVDAPPRRRPPTSCHSTAHQVEGSNRLSADMLRAILLTIPPDDTASALNAWLDGTGLYVAPLPPARTVPALLPAVACACADAGRLAEATVLATSDGEVTAAEADAIEAEAGRLGARASGIAASARRAVR